MKKRSQKSSINGVTQRTRRRRVGDFKDVQSLDFKDTNATNNKRMGFNRITSASDEPQSDIGKVAESTRPIIDESGVEPTTRRARRRAKQLAKKQKREEKHKVWRIFRRVAIVSGLAVALLVAVVGLKSWLTLQQIIDRGGEGAIALQENIDPSQLLGEGDGRVNVLLIGIGGDGHEAGQLADSIIVASIDPFSNELAILSVPRDLYVAVPGYWSTRINAAHSIGEQQGHEGGGIALMTETVESVLDIPIHYYVRVDFDGFVQAVDSVGGIEITLDGPVFDPNFDWEFGRGALDLAKGTHQLDGITALLLARARGASGVGIGVERGDFGRGDFQRDILLALKDKVLSAETFANPAKIASLLDTAGDHARTNLQIADMLRVYEIINEIPPESIVSFGLDTSADNYLRNANIDGASVLLPKSGNFTDIQEFVRELFVDGFIKQEAAIVDVLNGTSIAGVASEQARELRTYGYTVNTVANAPTDTFQTTVIYDLSAGEKPFTKQLLEQRFGVTVLPQSELPSTIDSSSNFVIVIGSNASETE